MENSNDCLSITFSVSQHINYVKFCCKMCVSLIWEDGQTNANGYYYSCFPWLSLWKGLNGVEIYNFLSYSSTVETARLLFTEFAARISRCRFQSLPVRFSQLKCSLATLTTPPLFLQMDEDEERRKRRREKNKVAAARCRNKKKERTDFLQRVSSWLSTEYWWDAVD